jgi:HSP20 family protein
VVKQEEGWQMALAVRSMWDPFTALVRQMDADFDALMRRTFGGEGRVSGFVPAADVSKVGNDVVITLELPGVDVENDVDVEVAEGRLVVSGRRSEEYQGEQEGVLVREIRSGEFRREFALPEHVSADQIDADYDKGLLRIRVRDVAKPAVEAKKIEVHSIAESEKPAIGASEKQTVEGRTEKAEGRTEKKE